MLRSWRIGACAALLLGYCLAASAKPVEQRAPLVVSSASRSVGQSFGRSLPEGNLIVGYAPDCNEAQIVQSAKDGVNVVIWFAVNLAAGGTIDNSLNFTCIARVAHTLRQQALPTAHLISVGGWDAPHPDTSLDGAEWFKIFEKWNSDAAASVPAELEWKGFDGIDWDLEGNDDPSSPWNHFTVECIDLVGTMSQAAKAAGFVVSLVPPQSYWDVTSNSFDLSLTHSYSDFHPEFHYRGDNCYAALLAKYGETNSSSASDVPVQTFDMVMVQLYESYSRACQAINGVGVQASDYLVSFIRETLAGTWTVDFSSVPALGIAGNRTLQLSSQQFVIGLSRGMGNGKSVFVWPSDVASAWERVSNKPLAASNRGSGGGAAAAAAAAAPEHALAAPGTAPRGVMFWNINNDNGPVNGTDLTSAFAKSFNVFLKVRK